MFRIAPLSIVAAAALAITIPSFAQTVAPGTIGPIITPGFGSIQQEPILLYDVTGSTLVGSIHLQLSVYNNGFAAISKFNHPVFPTPGIEKDVDMAWLSPTEVQKLRRKLAASGAFTNADQGIAVSDVPTTTMTVFKGTTNAAAHTYSYWLSGGGYAEPQAIVNDLIAAKFPGF